MRTTFGETRSSIKPNHALMSADSFETTALPNWQNTDIVVVISPQMGAKFSQYFATLSAESVGQPPSAGVERVLFVLDGEVQLQVNGETHQLAAEGYAFLPAGTSHQISSPSKARLSVLEKKYQPLVDLTETPEVAVGSTLNIDPVPLKGDEGLMLKKLMPQGLAYDFELNTMEFVPGASLAYVETHFMEHGLLMLDGGGVYRLDDNWYPVEAGDVIWMGPYCPQWFGAIGKSNARYLIYKDWNRDPLA